jgi:hypothetical protein
MLPALKFALNSTLHATKRYSPFQIVYGRCPNLAHMLHTPTHSYSEEEAVQRLVYMNRITQDVCIWQDEAFISQKRKFNKRSHTQTFDTGDIVYVSRPHSGHLAQKFQPAFKVPFTVITQKSHNNYLLQDCVKANRARSLHVNLIKHGMFREQLYDETVYIPLTNLEPPQQPTALLRTLANLNSTQAKSAHGRIGRIYDDNNVLLRDPAAAAGNGPIYGAGTAFQGHRDADIHLLAALQLPAVQIPQQPALQKEEEDIPLVESTSESDDYEFKNPLDRTIIQSSDNDKTPPTCTPLTSPSRPRRRRTSPTVSAAGATGARPRTLIKHIKMGINGENCMISLIHRKERKTRERKNST